MPVFQYTSLDPSTGKKRQGMVEAHSEKEAKDRLRDQGVMIIAISSKTSGKFKHLLKGDQLVDFTVQLAQLVGAGIPLFESLVALEEQYRGEPSHRVVLSLAEQIRTGSSLSEAMGSFPETFNRLYVGMIAAGESVGAIPLVLEKLSVLLTKQNQLKKQIVTSMIYPGILAGFSFIVILLLLGFVVPSIEGIFSERNLNGFTQAVLNVSYVFRNYWWIYIPMTGLIVGFAYVKLSSAQGKQWVQRKVLNVPLLKTLVIQTAMARFCRTMGTLLQGGMTMIDSLHISREVMGNVALEEDVKKAENRIIEGSSLSAELGRSRYVPNMVTRMLAVGEESGNAAVMLNRIAAIYEDALEKSLERLMALSQPVILIIMGTVIGIVLLAILLPLTDISSFIG